MELCNLQATHATSARRPIPHLRLSLVLLGTGESLRHPSCGRTTAAFGSGLPAGLLTWLALAFGPTLSAPSSADLRAGASSTSDAPGPPEPDPPAGAPRRSPGPSPGRDLRSLVASPDAPRPPHPRLRPNVLGCLVTPAPAPTIGPGPNLRAPLRSALRFRPAPIVGTSGPGSFSSRHSLVVFGGSPPSA